MTPGVFFAITFCCDTGSRDSVLCWHSNEKNPANRKSHLAFVGFCVTMEGMKGKRYIERKISKEVHRAAEMYPVVTICGPRQAGKTTLARHLFPEFDYVSMENPYERQAFEADALGFLARHPAPCIFDEVQNTPSLLSYLQGIVDEGNRNGMYILTGSRQMELQQSITQSLAGRTAIVDLLPLSLEELADANMPLSRDEAMFMGGLPRIYSWNQDPCMAYPDYFRTYVERDVRAIINVQKLREFEIFVRLLAARVGQLVNYASLANDVGVSAPTIRDWISMLEASYIIFTLHPYYKNYGKRLVKTPKIYFTETGLVASLLGIKSPEQVQSHPLVGNIFENLVVSEMLKAQLNNREQPNLFFYRDSSGLEIDIIREEHLVPQPIEIKSAMTYSPALCKNLQKFMNLEPQAVHPTLICGGKSMGTLQGINIVTFDQVAHVMVQNVDLEKNQLSDG